MQIRLFLAMLQSVSFPFPFPTTGGGVVLFFPPSLALHASFWTAKKTLAHKDKTQQSFQSPLSFLKRGLLRLFILQALERGRRASGLLYLEVGYKGGGGMAREATVSEH